MAVPVGEIIEVDLRLESVTEGILATGQIYAVAKGECIRCLDPIEIELNRTIQELYRYEPTNDRGGRKKKRDDEEDLDLEEDQVPVVINELNESALNFISQEQYEKALILL
jgi:uncharacterized protein